MELIIAFVVLLLVVLAIIWMSGAVFLNLDRKAGTRLGGPVIGLGILVGLLTAIFMVKFLSAEEPGGWGYGSLANATLAMVSPLLVLLGYWVVLGAGCLAKAATPDYRPIRSLAFRRAALFLTIPIFIGINHASSVVRRNSLETKAENWAEFIVDGIRANQK